MTRPLVIFRKYDENSDDEDDGEWGVSVDGKNPEPEYFFECNNKANAKKLQEILIDYFIISSKLYKEFKRNISDKYIDVDEEIARMTQPH